MSMIWVGGLDLGQQVVYKAGMEFLHPSQLEIFFWLFKHQLVIWYFEKLLTAMILHDHNLLKVVATMYGVALAQAYIIDSLKYEPF